MIRFLDGPAGGQSLMLQRAPLMLRVVINPRDPDGTWDALDSPDDTPRRGEVIHVYRRVTETSFVHLRVSGPGSGFYLIASYSFWRGHPRSEYLARTVVWRAWARLHQYTPVPPLIEHPRS